MLDFLYYAVSWVLLRWHDLFTLLGLSDSSGIGWTLSVVFLVITARLLLFRLFVKQVHYQRRMQTLQPQLAKIREKYKGDRAEMNRQMMKFQQEEGFNPVGGCLPMFLQIPVFLGLYHVLRHLANSGKEIQGKGASLCQTYQSGGGTNHLLKLYTFSPSETCHAATARLFGAPLASSFRDGDKVIEALGGTSPNITKFGVILPLLLISAAATLVTQLMIRANATTTPEGTAATIQRLMMYIVPGGVLVSGLLFSFPLGVLLYWFTSNLWTLAQQAYIIRFHPPTEVAAAPVGQLGKTLAPRPGARPQRQARTKPAIDMSKQADDDLADRVGTGKAASNGKAAGNGKVSNGHQAANGRSAANGKAASNGKAVGNGKAAPNGAGQSNGGKAAETAGATTGGGSADDSAGSVPRPGQKPNRQGGKRPPAKRPTQAKKRR